MWEQGDGWWQMEQHIVAYACHWLCEAQPRTCAADLSNPESDTHTHARTHTPTAKQASIIITVIKQHHQAELPTSR